MMDNPVFVRVVLALGVVALLYNAYIYTDVLVPSGRPVSSTERALETANAPGEPKIDENATAAPIGRLALARYVRALAPESRNPFLFGETAAADADTPTAREQAVPTLQGILIGEGRKIALIDGRARSEGELINGSLVKRIEVDHVVVVHGSNEIELRPPN